MAALAHTSWLSLALRLIPARLHERLDAWSLRLAQERAERRREAGRRRKAAATVATALVPAYKLRPWRD
ncbi:MAG TPA: hypothetical protein VLI46_15125 [Ramlibacter sp.]|nr:hypothetical protein [Ramlibacter sp.]